MQVNSPPDLKDLDLMEIPIEGVAAYWLALKKLIKTKRQLKILEKESRHTSEPYIKHLLELLLSAFPDPLITRYAKIKKATILKDLERKLILISIGVLGIGANENPQQILVRFLSKFPLASVGEKEIYTKAQQLLTQAQAKKIFVDIDHRLPLETLVSHLLFYCLLARRQGQSACKLFLPKIRSLYFREGIAQILDGFEPDFIKHRLNLIKDELVNETRCKMEMSLEMALAIKNNFSYPDIFKIANSFLNTSS